MTNKIIIAGFGGQGIILSGLLLAYSAMMEGKEVTHFPSYGAEMRGGTCNCSVVISDEKIASPLVSSPDICLIFNQPSKKKFENRCQKNGLLLLNSSLIDEECKRDDINSVYIDATNTASEMGNLKVANMIMLGAFIKKTNIISKETLIAALPKAISARNQSLIEINIQAIDKGYESIS